MAEDGSGKRKGIQWYEVLFVIVLVGFVVLGIFGRRGRRVGIVRLDAVAQALGIVDEVSGNIQQWDQDAAKQIEAIRTEFSGKMREMERQMDAAASEEEKDRIRAEMDTYAGKTQRRTATIQNEVRRLRDSARLNVRMRLKPFVTEIARRHRLDLVLAASHDVLSIAPGVDLTQEVIDFARNKVPPDSGTDLPSLDSPGLKKPEGESPTPLPAAVEGE
ncbi:MAG: OmpH family outer membrane protein [Kiritimatiellae bacterium]|nr:OmpH family outer membrane protein [Kiritimatiellia bacterium]